MMRRLEALIEVLGPLLVGVAIGIILAILLGLANAAHAATATDTGAGTTTSGPSGTVAFDKAAGRNVNPDDLAHFLMLRENQSALTLDPTCSICTGADSIVRMCLIDTIETAGTRDWRLCENGTDFSRLVNTGADQITDTQLLVGTGNGTGNYVTLSGDGTVTNAGAFDLTEANVEVELEGVLDLADLQGDLPLTTKTSGNYVQSLATTAPLAGGAAGSEGAVLTLFITADGIGPTEIDETAAYTWTGAHDFGGGIVEAPNATTPTGTQCDAAGEAGRVFVDTDEAIGAKALVCSGAAGWERIDTNAASLCSGSTTYLDGEGGCDDISGVYAAQTITLTAGVGLSGGGDLSTNRSFATASGEADFLASGALTCGAGTQGKAQVHTTALQYCDNAATPALQYAAYGNAAGESTAAATDSVALPGDTTGTYVASATAGGGLTLTGTEGGSLGIRTDCATNGIPKWDGDSWECGTDTSGGSPTSTDALMWLIDADNATAEVANGAGWCAEGGSGANGCMLYDSTDNWWELDLPLAVAGADGSRGITLTENTTEPGAPAAGTDLLYALGSNLYTKDSGDSTNERMILDTENFPTYEMARDQIYNVRDFGATCDGTTNDTAAYTAALAAIPSAGGILQACAPSLIDGLVIDAKPVCLHLAAGSLETNGPITFKNSSGGQCLRGLSPGLSGLTGSQIKWSATAAAAGGAVVKALSSSEFSAENFRIGPANIANPIPRGMAMANIVGGASSNRNGSITNVVVDGISTGLQIGFEFAPAAGAGGADNLCLGGTNDSTACTVVGDCPGGDCARNANNDHWVFINTLATNYTLYGYRLGHTQTYGHRFLGCDSRSGSGDGINGVRINAGALSWYGGFIGGHDNASAETADVYLGTANNQPILMSGIQSESSIRAVYAGVTASTGWPLILDGWRWDAEAMDACALDETAAECRAIWYRHGGPLIIRGGNWGSNDRTVTAYIAPSSVNLPRRVFGIVSDGVQWRSNAATPFQNPGGATTVVRWDTNGVSQRGSWCVGGSNPGAPCAVGGDCTGGGTCTESVISLPDIRELTDSTTTIIDNADVTKKLQHQLSGLSTATTRTVTWPDQNMSWATANTASTAVLRDSSGNFSAGTITAALTGNASTATALAADPADCGANAFATSIAASGALTCATPTLGTDTNGTYVASATASQGLLLTGTEPASLGLIDCAENEILKSTGAGGTSWTCQADATGGGGANTFGTIDTSSGTDPVADSTTDTLILTGTAPITVTGDSGADSATIALSQNAGTDVTADLEEEGVTCTGCISSADLGDGVVAQIDIDDTATLAGNPAFGDSSVWVATTGLIFEGATSNSNEGLLIAADVGADVTWTLPGVTGTIVTTGDTGSVTSTMIADTTIATGDLAFTIATTLAGTSGTPQTISNGDTATIAAGTGITTTAGATDTVTVAATLGVAIDTTEITDATIAQVDADDTATLAGNPAFGDNSGWWATTGIIFEGATSNTNELLLSAADPGADVTVTLPAATDTLVGKATTDVLTNKTLDAEATGNVVTLVQKVWLPTVGCAAGVAAPIWDTPAANAPTLACVTGTNTIQGVADFDAATDESLQTTLRLPADFTGAIDAVVTYFSGTGSTNTTGWCVQLICVADGETNDPAFPAQAAGNCVSDAGKGTANQVNDAPITGVTATGCAAGELLHVTLSRDANGGAVTDSSTVDSRAIGVELSIRRAQ